MQLTSYDLMQLSEDYLESLSLGRLCNISKKLLADLKEAHDRLNQNPSNSSVPPSSMPAYFGIPFGKGSEQEQDSSEEDKEENKVDDDSLSKKKAKTEKPPSSETENSSTKDDSSSDGKKTDQETDQKRSPGKQMGAPGYGRTQQIAPHHTIEHRSECCAACGRLLPEDAPFVAHIGFHVLDLQVGDPTRPGMQLICTLHRYGDSQCDCGHATRSQPGQGDSHQPEGRKLPTALNERRLIGPTLASLIVCLAFRMRLSRSRIREFLQDWLNLRLGTGTINNCISEAGLAAAPVEDQLIAEVRQSGLLFVDETPWKEWGRALWLWVFSTGSVVLFLVGRRTRQILTRVLSDIFSGWLMSDGHKNYRNYPKRLRCHAHLKRKAVGLFESLDEEAKKFGEIALFVLTLAYMQVKGKLKKSVNVYQVALPAFKELCELHTDSPHEKTRQLAVEFLNDWDTIWRILAFPDLPLTNNEAERALRHWVIARLISHGTRTPEGSRTLGVLASIIETCRARSVLPWPYLASVIAARRRGAPAPLLPMPTTVT